MTLGRFKSPEAAGQDAPRGFDDYQVTLGDVMRGERATLGKSLLDVQRELKIKASYIAAIEKGDSAAFETPGFIAGYVRSYARYLGLDPEWAFEGFCREAGFQPAHGLSAAAGGNRKASIAAPLVTPGKDIFSDEGYASGGFDVLGRVDFGAVASVVVLAMIVGAVGWGGWSVLQEVQRVQLTPVNAAPGVLDEVEPLVPAETLVADAEPAAGTVPSMEAYDRLYRPRALDVPVMVARDGPIAAIDPARTGVLAGRGDPPREGPGEGQASGGTEFATATSATAAGRANGLPPGIGPEQPGGQSLSPAVAEVAQSIDDAVLAALADGGVLPAAGPGAAEAGTEPGLPQVTADGPQPVSLVAVRETWVRVRDAGGSTIFETVMQPGERYSLPVTEEPPTLRTGNAGGVYFDVAGQTYGPVGADGVVVSNVALASEAVTGAFPVADLNADADLARVVAELSTD